MVKDIHISDFDYPLPDGQIARHPLQKRDACRLLVSHGNGSLTHDVFSSLPMLLPADSLLVCNDARVINARMTFQKPTGSRIEIFLLDPVEPLDYVLMFQTTGECVWKCLVGNLKRWKGGPLAKLLSIGGREVTLTAELLGDAGGNSKYVRFAWDDNGVTFASVVDAAGYIPIPPYLKRESEQTDSDDYQTVYSRVKGSVAAPTAGLHFTEDTFEALRTRGIDIERLTLHVGAGTFQPVKSETIGGHPMHREVISVETELLRKLRDAKKQGREVTAVGTTTVRTLESLPYLAAAVAAGHPEETVGQWWPYGESPYPIPETLEAFDILIDYIEGNGLPGLTASTAIMIAPGFKWRIVDRMVTNFHQPQSTLLLLVSSFLEPDSDTPRRWRDIYDEALGMGYRFLSYGDACLFTPLKS